MDAETGWANGADVRRVLIEAGERARRKRGRGEEALRMIKRVAGSDESEEEWCADVS